METGPPGAPVRLECEVPTLIRMTGRVAVVEPEFPGTTDWSVVTRLDPSAPEVLSYLGSSPRPQRRGDWWNRKRHPCFDGRAGPFGVA